VIGFAGAGALLLLIANAGQSIGGPLRRTAFLAPRRSPPPGDFPVNKTARVAGVTPEMTGAGYALQVRGARELRLTRAQLAALPQRTARLPIGCVEGWSTEQEWTGVPLAALARMAGVPEPSAAHVESLQPRGVLRAVTLNGAQVRADDALLALEVDGAPLSLDHGYPARVIAPAVPGVHNTKWVGAITFS
jgi:DMSO/TMAO reductase YedYZ molybdopterin-dependent catalytic subunit